MTRWLKPLWQAEVKGGEFGLPALVGQTLIAGDMGGVCRAIRLSDGTEIWRIAAGGGGIRGNVVADESVAYFATIGAEGTPNSEVLAVDVSLGQQRWRIPVTGSVDDVFVLAQTVVAISVLHIPVGSGVRYEVRLLEFDKVTGAVRRTVDFGELVPIALRRPGDGLIVARYEGNTIELIDLVTLGSAVVAVVPAPIGAAALTRSRLFVASGVNGLQAISVDTWQEVWWQQTKALCNVYGDEDNVVVAQSPKFDAPVEFRCFDARNGRLRWSVAEGNRLPSNTAGLFTRGKFLTQPRIRKVDTGQPEATLTVAYDVNSGREIGRLDSPFSTGWVIETGATVLSSHWDHIFALDLDRNWSVDLASAVRGTPVVQDSHVVVGTAGGKVASMRQGDGSLRWQQSLPSPVESSLAADSSRVYVGHAAGVSALDLATGAPVWTFSTAGAVTATLYRARDMILFGARDNRLHAVNFSNGNVVWTFPANGFVEGGATVEEDEIYVGSDDGTLYALDLVGGLRWKFETLDEIKSTPLVVGDMVVFGNAGGLLTALARVDGKSRWQVTLPGSLETCSPVLHQNGIIVADENGHIHRIKLTNGASFWTLERLGRLRGNIQLRDAIAYIGSLDGALVVVDISTGTLLRRVTVGAPVFASPALSADGIIVADEAGRVHSLLP